MMLARRSPDIRSGAITAGAVLLLLAVVFWLVELRTPTPLVAPRLPDQLSVLPGYALASFLRMLGAYVLSLIFSVVYGYFAATRARAEKIMLPILDVLQSIPILGFFPAALFFFVNLLNGSRAGVEMAAVFLIFTSQAWNMTFAVYEGLTTIPKELTEAAEMMGLTGWRRFTRLLLPATIPKLVYNSILSWAGGWYFLIAAEIIAIGPVNYNLPGLGSFLSQTAANGQLSLTLAGLVTLIAVIVLLDIVVWQPLSTWSDKFKYEYSAYAGENKPALAIMLWRDFFVGSALGKVMRRASLGAAGLFWAGVTPLGHAVESGTRQPWWIGFRRWARRLLSVLVVAISGYATVLLLLALAHLLTQPFPPEAANIPLAILASAARLFVAYIISLAWTLPVAVWIGRNENVARWLTPVFEIVASVPATALFPLIVVFVISTTGIMDLAAVLLVLTGMQWYLLFNLISGVKSIPGDMLEAARSMGIHGTMFWRRLLLPAIFPSLITGSITAWGGGWNALIVSEYVVYAKKTYTAFGIGSLLDQATYVTGNATMLVLSLLAMIVTITLLNRFVWRRLYNYAAHKFKIEY